MLDSEIEESQGAVPGDRYRIIRKLGSGGMGTVHEAEDQLLDRRVALKYLDTTTEDDQQLKYLLREAQAAARLSHPNVVAVYDFDRDETGFFISMELLPGGSLKDHLDNSGPLHWQTVLKAARDVCCGLSAAHKESILHRDIKPANLLVASGGSIKIADFGLVRLLDDSAITADTSQRVVGTANYMSPEACRSETLDERSDLYSLGATCFHLLTSRPPFREGSAVQVMFSHCTKQLPDLVGIVPNLPAAVSDLVKRAMEKEAVNRFQSAENMLAAIDDVLAAADDQTQQLEDPVEIAESQVSHARNSRDATEVLSVGQNCSEPTSGSTRKRSPRIATTVVGLACLIGFLSFLPLFNSLSDSTDIRTLSETQPEPGSNKNNQSDTTLPQTVFSFQTAEHLGNPAEESFQLDMAKVTQDGLTIDIDSDVETVAFSLDSRWLAAARYDKEGVVLWNLENGKARLLLEEFAQASSIAFSPDGQWLAVGSRDGHGVRLIDLKSGETTEVIGLPPGNVRGIQFLPSGGQLIVAMLPWSGDPKVYLWRIDVETAVASPFLPNDVGSPVLGFPISRPGNLLGLSTEQGNVQVFSLRDNARVWNHRTGGNFVTAVFDNSGARLAINGDRKIDLISTSDWQKTDVEIPLFNGNMGMAFSPDDSRLAVVTSGPLQIFDAATGQQETSLPGTGGTMFGLVISPNGRFTAAGNKASGGGGIRLWKTSNIYPARNASGKSE